MISKLGRLSFIAMFYLIVIGFYSTSEVVLAQGTTSASGLQNNPAFSSASVWSISGNDISYNSGNVGVGTMDPQAPGDQARSIVLDAGNFPQYILRATNAADNNEIWRFIARGDGNNIAQLQTLDNNYQNEVTAMEMKRSGNSIDHVTFPNGNVGIGDTTPTEAKLVVNGTAGNFSGVWSNLSDRRMKRDIKPLENSLSKILKLKGVSFYWKDSERGKGLQRGFIAQDVEDVIPEWVKIDDDGYKRLEKIGVEALLIEAIKELKGENDALKQDIKEVKDENSHLREKLMALVDRQEAIEDMFLAISINLSKDKLVKYDNAELDEVQKSIQ